MTGEQERVRNSVLDSPDWEYILAGHLLGTDWVHPEYGVDTIGKIRHTTEREQGVRNEFPEVVFKYAGKRLSVSGFLRRIDPNDIGDIEAACNVSERIVKLHRERSWRQIKSGDGDE